MLTCPSCGEATSARGSCPRCGGNLPDPVEVFIDSWMMAADSPAPRRAEDVECRDCGYSGEMSTVGDLLVCPACGAGQTPGQIADAPPGSHVEDVPVPPRIIDCPNCGRAIEVLDLDAGKSVICPSCNYFLGCMKKREARPWWFQRLLKGI